MLIAALVLALVISAMITSYLYIVVGERLHESKRPSTQMRKLRLAPVERPISERF